QKVKTPPYSRYTSAPEFSQLPEVSTGSSGDAPEVVLDQDTAKEARGPPSPWLFPIHLTPSDTQDGPSPRRTTVLILSIIVGVLAAAVVGLAAATGVMAKRANEAQSANAQLAVDGTCPPVTATTTTTTTATAIMTSPDGTSSPIAVEVVDISNGCDDKNQRVTGTTYTTPIFNKITFVKYCHSQPKQFPIYGMISPTFEDCMDACAAWTYRGRSVVGQKNANAVCGGVRFVPAWRNKTVAYHINARGNCFLQAAPQTKQDLETPALSQGVTCHAAVVVNLSSG
ncbi:hypothetical protein C8A00DRAFT_19811, partial [Chaetomidium leptoderma]